MNSAGQIKHVNKICSRLNFNVCNLFDFFSSDESIPSRSESSVGQTSLVKCPDISSASSTEAQMGTTVEVQATLLQDGPPAQGPHPNQESTKVEEHSLKCPECDLTFANAISLNAHQLTHKADSQFVCGICGKGFNTESLLSRHFITHSESRRYSTPLAGHLGTLSLMACQVALVVELPPASFAFLLCILRMSEHVSLQMSTGDVGIGALGADKRPLVGLFSLVVNRLTLLLKCLPTVFAFVDSLRFDKNRFMLLLRRFLIQISDDVIVSWFPRF